jgi:long-chain fatty acid transport protein
MICGTQSGFASGFGIFTQGADALGQANAVTAHADGPSAVFFNPALLTELPGTQVEIGTTAVLPSRDFKSISGDTSDNADTAYFPSTFYLTHQFNNCFSAGLGVNNPFGLGTVWESDWPGRFIATKSRITTFNINPSVACRISPHISLGAGLDILLLDAKLKNKIDGGPFGEIGQEFAGDGEGVGFNIGLLVNLTEALFFGAGYRSEIKVDIDGRAKFDIPGSAEPLASLFPNTGGQTSITLPQQVTAGLAYRISPAWVVEAGLRWEGWSSFQQLKITLDEEVGGETTSVAPRNWHDTWAYNIGTKYRLNDQLAVMAGYLYGQNPIPDSTFEPAIPDSDTHLFTAGAEVAFDNLKLALAYGFQLQEDRDKTTNLYGSIADGKYENYLHLVGVSLTCVF